MPATGGSTLNLLDKFYQDPEKYAYTFQNYVFMSRVMQVRHSDIGQAQPGASTVHNPDSLRAARADACCPLRCSCVRCTCVSVCVCVLQERNSANIGQPVRLMERSVFSDRMVFVRAVKESGWMGDVELAVYDSWFGPILDSNPSLVPDGFIYLRCTPDTCMERCAPTLGLKHCVQCSQQADCMRQGWHEPLAFMEA